MKTFNQIIKEKCVEKNNRLCIGLDLDNEKLSNNSIDYMEKFINDIIEYTIDHCPIYKINFSFYEKHGYKGYKILENIPKIVNNRSITIADAKRGDIGNSSKCYAQSIFEYLGYDSVTVNPYMGVDSILPFLDYQEKGVFILCLTSNSGSFDFQKLKINNKELYKYVALKAVELNNNNNIGLVVGATNSNEMDEIKSITKDISWLIPGVGTQGGDLVKSLEAEKSNGLSVINVSRDIIYSGNGTLEDIRTKSLFYTKKIQELL